MILESFDGSMTIFHLNVNGGLCNERNHLVPLTSPRMRKGNGTERQHETDCIFQPIVDGISG
jgi:hypothetical protein